MANVYGPILPIQLDSRNTSELLRAIQTRINIESGGALNDFTPASPLSAITEGQAFAESELLYYLNILPEAFTLQWLRLLGIQRKLGSRAYVDVTFFRTPGFNGTLVVPAGTKVLSDTLSFITLEESQVNIGEVSTTIPCRSEKWGEIYNVGASTITKIERQIPGLQSLTNVLSATGGSGVESIDDMKKRAFEVLSKRNITTAFDFETEVRSVTAEAAIVKVLTYEERFELSSNLSGSVVIVVGDENGRALSSAASSLVIQSLRPRVTLGTNISLVQPNVIPVDVVLEVYYNPFEFTANSDQYVSRLLTVLQSSISPVAILPGEKLDFQKVSRDIFNLDFVSNINTLDMKLMIKDPTVLEGACAGFSGEESEDELSCFYDYSLVVDKEVQTTPKPSSITTFKLYRAEIALTSSNDFSTLTYKFDSIYTP